MNEFENRRTSSVPPMDLRVGISESNRGCLGDQAIITHLELELTMSELSPEANQAKLNKDRKQTYLEKCAEGRYS